MPLSCSEEEHCGTSASQTAERVIFTSVKFCNRLILCEAEMETSRTKRKTPDFTIEEMVDISKGLVARKPRPGRKNPENIADAFKGMKDDLIEAYSFWNREMPEQKMPERKMPRPKISVVFVTSIVSTHKTPVTPRPEPEPAPAPERQRPTLGPLTLSKLKEKKDTEPRPANNGAVDP